MLAVDRMNLYEPHQPRKYFGNQQVFHLFPHMLPYPKAPVLHRDATQGGAAHVASSVGVGELLLLWVVDLEVNPKTWGLPQIIQVIRLF